MIAGIPRQPASKRHDPSLVYRRLVERRQHGLPAGLL
jgi:hypothetical protein